VEFPRIVYEDEHKSVALDGQPLNQLTSKVNTHLYPIISLSEH